VVWVWVCVFYCLVWLCDFFVRLGYVGRGFVLGVRTGFGCVICGCWVCLL